MKLPFSFFLALRYLKPKRSFLSVISVITLLGVTIGIAVLVVVIAVMTGFHEELRAKILGNTPHLMVAGPEPFQNEADLRKLLDAEPGVLATAPYVMGPVLFEKDSNFMPAVMRGVYPKMEERVISVKQNIKFGEFDLDGDKCVLGIELAKQLKVNLHDKVLIHGPQNLQEVVKELKKAEQKDPHAKTLGDIERLIQPVELEVTGLFESGQFQFDQEFLLVPLHIAQEVYGLRDEVHGIAIRSKDPFWADRTLKPILAEKLRPDFTVTSWIDQNRKFFQAVEVERTLLFFIVALVVVVAGFSITNTLITITFQKKRDIGVLKALGASPGRIIKIFVSQGIVVGLVGNALGFAAAGAIIYWRDQIQSLLAHLTGQEIFPKEVYQFSRIPAQIVPQDMLIIGGLSFAICVLAAMVPAWFAARLDPVKALREE